jgi:hypothetical protein
MRPFALVTLLLAVACGPPPKPGPQPNVTYFWRVISSEVEFNSMCSDEASFRMANGPLKFESNSYVVYKASEDAKKATLMKCTMLDPGTCTPADSGVVFDVAGAEMTYATELRTATGSGMCRILDTQTWIMTDKGMTLDIEISDTLSLVDDPMTCDQLEANAKARAPNGMGFQGCTITFKIGATSSRN